MGAVAGGVVGGVAGLALVLGAGYFFMRRRRSKARMNITDNGGREHHEDMYGNESPPDYDHKDPVNNEVASSNEIYEVSAQRRSEICEMDGGSYYSPSDNASTKEVHVAPARELRGTVG
jgi:LPXTG-motif cell wall-anchored protein